MEELGISALSSPVPSILLTSQHYHKYHPIHHLRGSAKSGTPNSGIDRPSRSYWILHSLSAMLSLWLYNTSLRGKLLCSTYWWSTRESFPALSQRQYRPTRYARIAVHHRPASFVPALACEPFDPFVHEESRLINSPRSLSSGHVVTSLKAGGLSWPPKSLLSASFGHGHGPG